MIDYSKNNKEPRNGRLRVLNNDEKIRHLGLREEQEVAVYTDGSAYRTANSVGYSFIVSDLKENKVIKISKGLVSIGKKKKRLAALYAETVAVLKAVDYITKQQLNNVIIYTDNLYLYKAVKGYDKYLNPILRAFVNRLKPLITNLFYNNQHVDIAYISGHAGVLENELADFYAKDSFKRKNSQASINIDVINTRLNEFNEFVAINFFN